MAVGKDDNAARLASAAKLLAIAFDLHEKTGDVLAEIDELLGGGVGMAAKLQAVMGAFDSAWSEVYAKQERGRYVWNHRVDAPNAKRLIKLLGVDEVVKRVPLFMADGYDQLRRARHPFGWFVKNVNSYATIDESVEFSLSAGIRPVGCRHEPFCKDDATHTIRKRREVEAGA